MKGDRTRLLLVLGAAAIMTGVVFGTGAFTQVEAERTVDVEIADDANAFLQITSEDDNYTDTTGNALSITLNSSSGADGSGVNDNAVTTIDPIVNITNQGTQPVDIMVDGAPQGVNLTNLPANGVGVGDGVDVGINISTDASRPVNGGEVGSNITDTITINATTP